MHYSTNRLAIQQIVNKQIVAKRDDAIYNKYVEKQEALFCSFAIILFFNEES